MKTLEPQQSLPYSEVTNEHGLLHLSQDGRLLLDERPIRHIIRANDARHLLCYTRRQDGMRDQITTVAASAFLAFVNTSGYTQTHPQDGWLPAYVRAQAALSEVLSLYAATPVCTVLRGMRGSEDFIGTLSYAREAQPHSLTHFPDDETLLAACLCLAYALGAVRDDFEQSTLAALMPRIQGGGIFLEAMQQLREALCHLPFAPRAAANALASARAYTSSHPSQRLSVIDKKEEYVPLRDEILKQIDWQQALFLTMLTADGIFLSLALQPGVAGLVAMILPIFGLGMAMKMAAHDLRAGQINYYLRFVLKSPWEIRRRHLFDGREISQQEHQILGEQGMVVDPLLQEKHQLAPPFPHMQALANRIVFFTMDGTALGIGIIRTYQNVLHHDLLSIFVWLLAFLAAGATIVVLQRRRVR